ncbi:hypothetical protein GF369_03370 [Candidatus Peregrinibacteria bacterium]|nr:hypothetical protein [Candidatus Peregrinibacteria bacterium]
MPRIPRKRPIDYILPFLIMICTGVIVVLGYQLWNTIQGSEEENDIYVYVAQGNAKILPWGAGEWERVYNGTRLLQEDSIKTQNGGRVVIELFEDHYVRMDEKSEVTLSNIRKSGEGYEIDIQLLEGKIWVNNNDQSDVPVKFTVSTDHTMVKTLSTIYEVEQMDDREAVRVIKGDILADIMIEEDGEMRKVETLNIGVGQQAVITDDDLDSYADRTMPSVIDALSDDFRGSSFYKWNMAEDQHPTDFSINSGTYDPTIGDDAATEEVDLEEGDLAKPEITVPSTLTFATPESSLTIRGTTVAQTEKMMVDVTSDEGEETYELNLYVPGNTEWSFAVSQAAGTLNPGMNTYEFYALGEEDDHSGKTELIVNYQTDELEEDDEASEDESEEEDLDLGPLVAPEVESYNDGDSNIVEVGDVKVVGSVAGAKEINVSGYTLQAFEPGDTTWVYYAKESLGNLDPGENNFTVTAIAPDGTQEATTFVITYNKPEEEVTDEEPVEDTGATENPAL